MICENCGKNNKDAARFCSECGKALIDKPIELDLQQIKIPAISRKPKIIKVSTKNGEDEPTATDVDSLFLPKDEVDVPVPESADEEAKLQELGASGEEDNKAVDKEYSSPFEPDDYKEGEEINFKNDEPIEATPSEKPMSIGAWIGTFVLTAIPFLNIILLLVWAISKKTNKSKKTYAAAILIVMVIFIVLGVVAFFVLSRFTKFNPVDFINNKF